MAPYLSRLVPAQPFMAELKKAIGLGTMGMGHGSIVEVAVSGHAISLG
ncbi:MAG: hypothetical protein PVG64_03270 [Syntrophobacterales bacterium]|jgi:hypothetical protein